MPTTKDDIGNSAPDREDMPLLGVIKQLSVAGDYDIATDASGSCDNSIRRIGGGSSGQRGGGKQNLRRKWGEAHTRLGQQRFKPNLGRK